MISHNIALTLQYISFIKDILQQLFLIKSNSAVLFFAIDYEKICAQNNFIFWLYVQIWIIDIVFASFSNFRRKNRGGVRGLGYDP